MIAEGRGVAFRELSAALRGPPRWLFCSYSNVLLTRDERGGDVADDLEGGGGNLVERVAATVVMWIFEIDHVDYAQSLGDQRNMVIGDRAHPARDEVPERGEALLDEGVGLLPG